MATTILDTFEGTPTLDETKVDVLLEWYASAQGDEDKATEPDDNTFYEGQRMAYQSVLHLLYGTALSEFVEEPSAEACQAAVKVAEAAGVEAGLDAEAHCLAYGSSC